MQGFFGLSLYIRTIPHNLEGGDADIAKHCPLFVVSRNIAGSFSNKILWRSKKNV